MYRHEKTPENSTALLTSVTGFEENPTDIFLTEMKNIVPEMQDLLSITKALNVFALNLFYLKTNGLVQY